MALPDISGTARVLVVEADVAPFDDDSGHLRSDLERVAFGHEEVRILAGLEAADPVGHAEDLRGVDRQRLQGLLTIEAPRHRHRRVVGKVPRIGGIARGERDFHAGLGELSGELIVGRMEGVFPKRRGQDVADHDRNVALLQQRRDRRRLRRRR